MAAVRRTRGLGLLLGLALCAVALVSGPSSSGYSARSEQPAGVTALAHTTTVLASLGAVERAASSVGQAARTAYAPPPALGLGAAALLLLAAVVAALSGLAGGLGRRRLRDRAPPVS